MTDIHDKLTWILGDFKDGSINYAEAIEKIEEIYVRAVGGVPFSVLRDIEKRGKMLYHLLH
jgi:hypothetical protein